MDFLNYSKRSAALLLALLLATFNAQLLAQDKPQGALAKLEGDFDALLDKESINKNVEQLASKPHHLGSAGSKEVAEKIHEWFKSYGWDAKIETYHVLFPTPTERQLQLLGAKPFTARLEELPLEEDPYSSQEGQLPTYNAWGADGDVTAPLVFVNYGLPADYEVLARLGIDVKGKIVIAKYGNSWRGIKPKVAYEHGAVGCLIYSDPKEDGYFQGDGYPDGAFKNEHTVQRGSVMDMVLYPGDPLTPGYGAIKEAKRLKREEAVSILKIPVLPISYHDAKPLLEALGGPVAPAEWRGALPLTYKLGGGEDAMVHLKIKHSWDIVPNYNVIATLKGSEYPDQWVIRGNHHDAWVNGANDPVSGLAALMEEAKAIGLLAKQGFRPKRTLVYCAWDGEEPSLIGSTEWVEDHAEELSKKAVAYINTDGNSRGFFNAGGSHALTSLVTSIAHDVKDPIQDVSVFQRRRARELLATPSAAKKQQLLTQKHYNLSALGTGSDYSSFLQHLGIPSINFGFGGEGPGGEYHSIYDTYTHYVRFKDPDFSYGRALAQVSGRAVLRLSEAEVLPFDFSGLHQAIKSYADEVVALAKELRQSQQIEQRLQDEGIFELAADPTKPFVATEVKVAVPEIDFSGLLGALDSLSFATEALHKRQSNFSGNKKELSAQNEKLYQAEKALLLEEGLPRRPWYKHSIYAPGFYTGYGVKTLPGVREALEEGHYQELEAQLLLLAQRITVLAQTLDGIF